MENNERYFTVAGAAKNNFIKMPKVFMNRESKYFKLSSEAKLMYSVFYDRTSLSLKNKWIDEEGRIYFIYSVENQMIDFGYGNQKIIKLNKELVNAGLLIKKNRGQGKPALFYLQQIEVEIDLAKQEYALPTEKELYIDNEIPESAWNQEKCENHISSNVNITLQESPKSHANKNNYNKTNINNTKVLLSSSKEDEEDSFESDLKMLLSFCNNVNYKLTTAKAKNILVVYSVDKVIKAITHIITTVDVSEIKNYAGYLMTTLKDIDTPKNIVIENKIENNNSNKEKVTNFNNFTQREYDVNKLENQLLGWDNIDDEEEPAPAPRERINPLARFQE